MKLSVEDVADHFQRVIIVDENGCWLWQGAIGNHGYALYGGKLVYGIVWRMTGQSSDGNIDLRHQCKPKNCINPDHILTGTRSENMMDASRDGTLGRCRWVTDEQVEQIRTLLEQGIQKSTIARTVGVSPQYISKFLKGDIKYAKPSEPPVQ